MGIFHCDFSWLFQGGFQLVIFGIPKKWCELHGENFNGRTLWWIFDWDLSNWWFPKSRGCSYYLMGFWLVVWLPCFIFPINIGFLSSSQLTKSYFSEGLKPPTRIFMVMLWRCSEGISEGFMRIYRDDGDYMAVSINGKSPKMDGLWWNIRI